MRKPRGGLASKATLCLLLFLAIFGLLIGNVAAQGDNPEQNKPDAAPAPAPAPPADKPDNNTPAPPAATPPPDDKPTPSPAPTPSPTPPPAKPSSSSSSNRRSQSSQSSQSLPGLTSASSTSSSTSSSAASTTTSTSTGKGPAISLPSLTGGPVIPTPQIPPVEGAPYLKTSNLPEGTIFIAVGAALGFIGLVVIAWRLLVAWSINRSVRRATNHSHPSDATALLHPNTRKSGLYQNSPVAAGSREKMPGDRRSRVVSTHPPNQSLFFSPTAGANLHSAGNRGSSYLPAGYYAASSSSPGGGAGLSHMNGPSMGLSPLGPQAQGYSRTRSGPSPPGSPGLPPSSRDHDQAHQSTSSLNLSVAPQGRAPSAYLEDLFENHHHPPGR